MFRSKLWEKRSIRCNYSCMLVVRWNLTPFHSLYPVYVTDALIFHVGNILSAQGDLTTLFSRVSISQKILSPLKCSVEAYEIGRERRERRSIDNEQIMRDRSRDTEGIWKSAVASLISLLL